MMPGLTVHVVFPLSSPSRGVWKANSTSGIIRLNGAGRPMSCT
jgi:hypothetical protein